MNGKVYLIGAGPGDPGLFTLKGMRALALCDVVLYDALVNPLLLQWVPSGSVKIFAGKRRGSKPSNRIQSEINRMMAAFAKKGQIVARLKGGDPFLFGRGGEEAEYLAQHRVDYEVVPGVSSVTAAPASAGIPVTDRRYTSMLTVVTGHSSEDLYSGPKVHWDKISKQGTLVILMGAGTIKKTMDRLQQEGWPKSMPAACIRWGTLPAQTVLTGNIGNMAKKALKLGEKFGPPVVIVVGNVVKMRPLLCR